MVIGRSDTFTSVMAPTPRDTWWHEAVGLSVGIILLFIYLFMLFSYLVIYLFIYYYDHW